MRGDELGHDREAAVDVDEIEPVDARERAVEHVRQRGRGVEAGAGEHVDGVVGARAAPHVHHPVLRYACLARAAAADITRTAAAWSTCGIALTASGYGSHTIRLRGPTVPISSAVRGSGFHDAGFAAATHENAAYSSADARAACSGVSPRAARRAFSNSG